MKQEVFKKYRNRDAEIVFIDPKLTKPTAFIQRGMLKPNNHIYNELSHQSDKNEKLLNNFLKNYISRKERRELQEDERYYGSRRESFGVSNIELSNAGSTLTQRNRGSRSVFSRAQTARSVTTSNKEN